MLQKHHASFWVFFLMGSSVLVCADEAQLPIASIAKDSEGIPLGVVHRELSFYLVAGKEVLHGPFRESMGEKLFVSGNYIRGEKNDLWEKWHTNGLPKSTQLWKTGLRNGPYRAWSSSGNLMTKVIFKEGKKNASLILRP